MYRRLESQTNPDLTVTLDISIPAGGFIVGSSFRFGATVRNDGDGAAEATTLRYYRSTDATIKTSDTAVGTDAVGALSASGNSAESISLTAPSTAGTYYYGACVDTVANESDTTNNCSASVQVTVRQPGPPDLIINGVLLSGGQGPFSVSLILTVGVQNNGDETSLATTLRYYRSTDATITISDTEEGTAAVAGLAGSNSINKSVNLTAPSSPGTYYYGACVDAVADESDTTNNCSASVKVDVN